MDTAIPPRLRRLFWDMEVQGLDARTHQAAIIERVLNLGTLEDWRWLVGAYGTEAVRRSASDAGRGAVRPESRRLASLILG